MSGGSFEYAQHKIRDIYESIEFVIENNGEDPDEVEYSEEIIEIFKEGVKTLKKAYAYAHEIDYLLASDTGEDTFVERLDEKFSEI